MFNVFSLKSRSDFQPREKQKLEAQLLLVGAVWPSTSPLSPLVSSWSPPSSSVDSESENNVKEKEDMNKSFNCRTMNLISVEHLEKH